MPCSPLLREISEPIEVLRVVRDHPILCCSEPPGTFRPLAELGWAVYVGGRWRITAEGEAQLGTEPTPAPPQEFFDL